MWRSVIGNYRDNNSFSLIAWVCVRRGVAENCYGLQIKLLKPGQVGCVATFHPSPANPNKRKCFPWKFDIFSPRGFSVSHRNAFSGCKKDSWCGKNSLQLKFFNFIYLYTIFHIIFSLFLVNYVIFHVGFYAKLKIVFLCFSVSNAIKIKMLFTKNLLRQNTFVEKKKISRIRIISHVKRHKRLVAFKFIHSRAVSFVVENIFVVLFSKKAKQNEAKETILIYHNMNFRGSVERVCRNKYLNANFWLLLTNWNFVSRTPTTRCASTFHCSIILWTEKRNENNLILAWKIFIFYST